MANVTFFIDQCPSCKTKSRFFIAYLGCRVRCSNCSYQWEATDRESESLAMTQPICKWNCDPVDSEQNDNSQPSNRPR